VGVTLVAVPNTQPDRPSLSIVVVTYNMHRELPRTLQSLGPDYQRGVRADDYEVVVVDNGSREPVDPSMVTSFPGRIRAVRLDPAPPSPARAANLGVDMADGAAVGLIVDGARITSPGLLAQARLALRVADRPIVTAPGYHLGAVRHMDAHTAGYDQQAEDRLLAAIDWPSDGYRLFEIAILAASSGRGWFGPMGESSALFLPRSLWNELGGLDERFSLSGGGLVNHDLYRRACALPRAQLIALLGEGTFHQFHGGAATSRRVSWDEMNAEYETIRHEPYRPLPTEPLYLGHVPPSALSHVEESVRLARERVSRSGGGSEGAPATVYGAFLDR
jgi:Glycosyl transferase family 2